MISSGFFSILEPLVHWEASCFCSWRKKFDEVVHGACNAIFDALRDNETLNQILFAVLAGFFLGLTAYLRPPPRCQTSQIYASDHELMRKQTKEQQKEMAKRLDKVKNAGMTLTISMVIGKIIWETGVLFWIIHEYYSHVILFTGVFILGAGSSFVGIWLRNFTAFGLTPFVVGNMFLIISTFSLKGPSEQLEKMFDNTRETSATWMIIGFVLTQTTVFWWDSFVVASFCCLLYIGSMLWYCLSYIHYGRYAAEKALSG